MKILYFIGFGLCLVLSLYSWNERKKTLIDQGYSPTIVFVSQLILTLIFCLASWGAIVWHLIEKKK